MSVLRITFLSVFLLGCISCANINLHKDIYDDPNLQPRVLSETSEQVKTNKKAVLIHSFWNNQGKDLSGVKRIDYSLLLRKDGFYSALSKELKTRDLYLFSLDELRFAGAGDTKPDEHKQVQLSLYNSLIMIKEFLVEHPVPKGFEGASFPGLIKLKNKNPDESWNGYVVIGLEQLYSITEDGRYVRSGVAVVKVDSKGEYLAMAIDTYDFTYLTSEKMAVIVAELISVLET